MGDDGVVQVNGVHDVPNDAVGIQRHFVAGEAGQPFGHPRLAAGGDFVGEILIGRALLGALRFQLVDELAQGQLGVAEDGVLGAMVLVDVAVAVGQVNQRLAGWNGHGEAAFGETDAGAEDDVAVGEEAMHRPGLAGTADTQRQRVILREGALALQGGQHRDLQKLGQLQQLVGSLGVEYALAGHNHRALGSDESAGGGGDGGRVGGDAHGLRRYVVEILFADLVGGQVGRDFQKHRPRLAGAQLGERLAHQFRHPVGKVDVGRPLGDGLVGADGVEVRLHADAIAGHAGWQHQYRHRVGVSLGHAAEGVFGAGAVLGQKDAGFAPVGDAGKAVGHMHAGALLAAYHRPDAGDGGGLNERIGRHYGNPIDALHFQNVGNCGNSVHGAVPPSQGFAPMRGIVVTG